MTTAAVLPLGSLLGDAAGGAVYAVVSIMLGLQVCSCHQPDASCSLLLQQAPHQHTTRS